MALPKGTIDVRILDDGTVRVETGDMGGVAHKAADDFIRDLQTALGGDVVIVKAEQSHTHGRTYGHEHEHEHADGVRHRH